MMILVCDARAKIGLFYCGFLSLFVSKISLNDNQPVYVDSTTMATSMLIAAALCIGVVYGAPVTSKVILSITYFCTTSTRI